MPEQKYPKYLLQNGDEWKPVYTDEELKQAIHADPHPPLLLVGRRVFVRTKIEIVGANPSARSRKKNGEE